MLGIVTEKLMVCFFSRGSFYGLYTMTRTAAPSFGPVLGGVIADRLSWR